MKSPAVTDFGERPLMFDDLNTIAAIAVRDAIEAAIGQQEALIKMKMPDGLRPDVERYLNEQHSERVLALAQLRRLRKAAHGRVFDSIT